MKGALRLTRASSRHVHGLSSRTRALSVTRAAYGAGEGGEQSSSSSSVFRGITTLLGGLAIAATTGSIDTNAAENCGIVGIVAEDGTEASEFLIEGLTILRNRGYDSAGVATVGGKRRHWQSQNMLVSVLLVIQLTV